MRRLGPNFRQRARAAAPQNKGEGLAMTEPVTRPDPSIDCPACRGRGRVAIYRVPFWSKPCPECDGLGRVTGTAARGAAQEGGERMCLALSAGLASERDAQPRLSP